ncbi:MAG: hypothetical protein AAF720_09120 [Pseudomonadota bacterium]
MNSSIAKYLKTACFCIFLIAQLSLSATMAAGGAKSIGSDGLHCSSIASTSDADRAAINDFISALGLTNSDDENTHGHCLLCLAVDAIEPITVPAFHHGALQYPVSSPSPHDFNTFSRPLKSQHGSRAPPNTRRA